MTETVTESRIGLECIASWDSAGRMIGTKEGLRAAKVTKLVFSAFFVCAAEFPCKMDEVKDLQHVGDAD